MKVSRGTNRRWVLTATILGSSMAFIDGTVVNIALPALQATMGATIADVQWVVEAYTLFLAALMLTGGALGDRFGRKRIFLIGIAAFTAGSIACGLAPNMRALIAFRALQGIGAALSVPGSLAIISATFPDDERGKAIGTWSAFTSITMVIGPLLGGTLIDHASWRAIFFINAPLAAIVLYLTLRYMPETRETKRRSLDVAGAALATAGLGSLIYGLIESSTLGLTHPRIVAALAGGAALLAAFVVVEWRSASPMMPLALFRSTAFAGANAITLFLYAALAGCLFFVPMNLMQVQGFSATQAGAAMIPSVLLLFLLSRWAGGLAHRIGAKPLLIIGPTIAAGGFALFLLPGTGASYWTGFFPAFVVLGFGMSLTVAPLTTTVMTAVSREHSGVASGVNNAISETAGLLAIAVFGLAMSQAFNHGLERGLQVATVPPDVQQEIRGQEAKLAAIEIPKRADVAQRQAITQTIEASFVAGFRLVMTLGVALGLLSALCAWITLEGGVEKRPPRSTQA
jgi:EmrB/QacA subfamily drug resistance transporter